MQTRDQRYAVAVYEQVTKIKRKYAEGEQYKKYGAISHKLPILIHTAGLIQALAFVESRGQDIQKLLLADLNATLGLNDSPTLLERVRSAELGEYMRLTQQIMAALLWYKRFAQSVLDVDASEAATVLESEDRHG